MRSPRPFSKGIGQISRREFTREVVVGSAGLAFLRDIEQEKNTQVTVSVAKARKRETALLAALELVGLPDIEGREVYIKGNYNSADCFPATTHPDTLRMVARALRQNKCGRLFLVERSGMGSTRYVWDRLGIPALAGELGLTLIALEDLTAGNWRKEELSGSHWRQGVEVPRFLDRETCVVQICNLKTHRFGGQFSASLKNSIGLIAKYSQGSTLNYMEELHGSASQRLMIAEVNQIYQPRLIVMDAMQVFISGGPEAGDLASPEIFLASRDRVAIDATGVALLRHHGAGPALGRQGIFEFEQIKRAAELNVGARSGDEIRLISKGSEGESLAAILKAILAETRDEEKK